MHVIGGFEITFEVAAAGLIALLVLLSTVVLFATEDEEKHEHRRG